MRIETKIFYNDYFGCSQEVIDVGVKKYWVGQQ